MDEGSQMIKVNPPLDQVEKHFEHIQEKIQEIKKTAEYDDNDPQIDPTTKLIFSQLSFVFTVLYDQAGFSSGTAKMIRVLSEMIDKNATKDQVQEQIQIIEKRVVDTLQPIDNLLTKVKEAQAKSPEYIG